MAGWNDVLKEITETQSQHDYVRKKYVSELASYTNRNVITYYSSWLKNPQANNTDINDADMTGFMNCIHGMDCSVERRFLSFSCDELFSTVQRS